MSTTTSDEQHQLRRGHLSLPDVIAQSVSVIAPAMSGGFLTYLAATKAGGATPLSYVLAAIGALFLGGVVSEFSKSMASAGSLYTYVANGWNKTAGFVLGWVYSIAFIILGAAVLAGFGFFASSFVQAMTESEKAIPWWVFFLLSLVFVAVMSLFNIRISTLAQLVLAGFGFFASSFVQAMTESEKAIPWWVFFLLSLVFVAVMSLFNIRISTRAQLVLAALTVVVMVIAAIVAIKDGGPNGKSIDFGAFSPGSAGVKWSGIFLGLAFGILSFTGFEAGAVLAEETENPRRNIPRAIVGSVLVAAVFYIIVTYATSIGFGVKEATEKWPGSAAGLVAVVTSAALGKLVLLAVAISSLICGLGVGTVATRFLYTMGRERVLPGFLGKTNAKWKTPWNAIIVYLVVSAVLIFGLLALSTKGTQIGLTGGVNPDTNLPATPTELRGGLYAFAEWATLATPLVMLSYVILGIAGILRGRSTNNSRLLGASVLGTIVGVVATYGSLYYSFVEGAPGAGIAFVIKVIPWACLVVLVLGVVIAMVLKSSKPHAWEAMGAVFDE